MASSIAIALRRAATISRCSGKLIYPASASRSFNTNTQVNKPVENEHKVDVERNEFTNPGEKDSSVDVKRRPDRSVSRRHEISPSFFPDVFDPFSPPRSLNQLLNFVDQFMENPFTSRDMGSPSYRGWEVKEKDDTLILQMDMPGLSKDDVKITVQQNTLIIKGETEKESSDDGDENSGRRRYASRFEIPSNLYKIDGIEAEMKNGVLKLFVPKVKEEERKDVFEVKVE